MQTQGNPAMAPAVQEAMQRRAGSPGGLNATSAQAPMANPMPQPSTPSSLGEAPSMGQGSQGSEPKAPKFEPQERKDLIVLALIEQLKNDNKLDKEKSQIPAQPSQPSPAMPSMGGGSLSPGFQPMARSQMQGSGDYTGLNNYGQGF